MSDLAKKLTLGDLKKINSKSPKRFENYSSSFASPTKIPTRDDEELKDLVGDILKGKNWEEVMKHKTEIDGVMGDLD
jgi:hypothetical protein